MESVQNESTLVDSGTKLLNLEDSGSLWLKTTFNHKNRSKLQTDFKELTQIESSDDHTPTMANQNFSG
ncbi:unnamed protein product [Rhizophagus irregularis]|nr:unnamed protein product [Rhizophagus irregularis]